MIVLRQVFVVRKRPKRPGDGEQVWVFSDHADALRCRLENKISSDDLVGCVVDCYEFKKLGDDHHPDHAQVQNRG